MHKIGRTNVPGEKKCLLDVQIRGVYKSLHGSGEGESARHSRGSMLNKCLSFVSKIHPAISKKEYACTLEREKKISKCEYLQETQNMKF